MLKYVAFLHVEDDSENIWQQLLPFDLSRFHVVAIIFNV